MRVIDGDTVVLDISLGCDQVTKKRYCRLLDIDAPEVVGKTKKEGLEATTHLRALLAQADPLLIRTRLDRSGSFRRLLVELWDGAICLNEQMIKDGFATPRD